jgi:hypothetical protein
MIQKGMEIDAVVAANLGEAERRVQCAVCPIYGIDSRDRPQLIGSAIPFRVAAHSFLLTAAHVLDENKQTTLYVGGVETLVPLAGSSHRVRAPNASRQNDKLDFGFVDISDTPPHQWSRYRFTTPEDLDLDDIPGGIHFTLSWDTRRQRTNGFSV